MFSNLDNIRQFPQRADVSPLDFTPIWQRSLVIDFGRIYSTDNVVIISRAPRAFIKPLLLLQIFTPFVSITNMYKILLVLYSTMELRLKYGKRFKMKMTSNPCSIPTFTWSRRVVLQLQNLFIGFYAAGLVVTTGGGHGSGRGAKQTSDGEARGPE